MRVEKSHAQTGCQVGDESRLLIGNMTFWMYTANAVTVRERSSRTVEHGLGEENVTDGNTFRRKIPGHT